MTFHDAHEPLFSRLLLGALSGFAATTLMTVSMRRTHGRLPKFERYPLPPREISERLLPIAGETALRDASLAAHFGYGGFAGALLAVPGSRPGAAMGAAAGLGVWAASYFGLMPGLAILRPASTHPVRRNALMIAAHLVWGATTALGIRELAAARSTILAGGDLRDAPLRKAASD